MAKMCHSTNMTIKKYNFIPEHQVGENEESAGFTVSINKAGILYISGFNVKMFGLENKIVRFYADVPNKSIAFKEIKGGNIEILKNVRKLNPNLSSGGLVQLSIAKLVKKLGIENKQLPMRNVPVTEYKDTMVDEVFHVIDLRNHLKITT